MTTYDDTLYIIISTSILLLNIALIIDLMLDNKIYNSSKIIKSIITIFILILIIQNYHVFVIIYKGNGLMFLTSILVYLTYLGNY